ncbi:MAG: S-adenosylmethionine:tRNA ribosyltransferase-isomerase [Paludibacteraceae bacterium]|nr:S-adenosylmethionine:tRNA ribosyltransferase-isomerase [Paludibacteraceae bacterium]
MSPLLIERYDYPLPEERIAKYPLAERDMSKLLIFKEGEIREDRFRNIGEHLPAGAHLIYNNTRVIQARLVFHKESGARIEVFCLEPLEPHDYQLSLGSQSGCTWKCMVGNLKKWKAGVLEMPVAGTVLRAERLLTTGNTHSIRFTWDDATLSFAEILDAVGELPIPPYLNRATEESDKRTYQTVYSRIKGSVAAPTAGLHFTENVLQDLKKRGVGMSELTLHVGAGTFQPVKTADANEHTMHTEIVAVPRETIQDVLKHLGHVVAVGTTSVRTLESLYYIGVQMLEGKWSDEECHVGQFEPYEREYTTKTAEALQAILDYLDKTKQSTLHAETQIMIRPGFVFRIVSQMITNFHQPKSTLLLLVSAFLDGESLEGKNWHAVYDYALQHDFRFLSYGDSNLFFGREVHD